MSRVKDLTNQRFGRLTVLEFKGVSKSRSALWLCKCDCGNVKIVRSRDLVREHVKSCGCLKTELPSKRFSTHKLSKHRLYKIWDAMKHRCLNPNSSGFYKYGGRGITICDEWKNDFKAFYDWAMNNGYGEGLTIDRIDNNGNYRPNNCRWVDVKIQGRNKRNNRLLTCKGETHCLSEWVELLGFKNHTTILSRLRRGWSIERALTEPIKT